MCVQQVAVSFAPWTWYELSSGPIPHAEGFLRGLCQIPAASHGACFPQVTAEHGPWLSLIPHSPQKPSRRRRTYVSAGQLQTDHWMPLCVSVPPCSPVPVPTADRTVQPALPPGCLSPSMFSNLTFLSKYQGVFSTKAVPLPRGSLLPAVKLRTSSLPFT